MPKFKKIKCDILGDFQKMWRRRRFEAPFKIENKIEFEV